MAVVMSAVIPAGVSGARKGLAVASVAGLRGALGRRWTRPDSERARQNHHRKNWFPPTDHSFLPRRASSPMAAAIPSANPRAVVTAF